MSEVDDLLEVNARPDVLKSFREAREEKMRQAGLFHRMLDSNRSISKYFALLFDFISLGYGLNHLWSFI